MRIIFLLGICLLLTEYTFGQKLLDTPIDFSAEDISLHEALIQLRQEEGIRISYSPDHLPRQERISLELKNTPLREVLNQILASSSLTYKEGRNKILLHKRKVKKYSISGYIEDAENRERLISARIYCPQLRAGTYSNEYGFFSMSLEAGEYELEFHYVGYQVEKRRIKLTKNQRLQLELSSNLSLPEQVISPVHTSSSLANENPDQSLELGRGFINISPALVGEADPVRTAHLLPGVQGGVDGLGGTFVRGGESGHNLMMLDGVPVYIPFHLLGAYSIYNNSTIRSAKLLKGNFSARYGGRLGAYFDVRTREGNRNKWMAEVSGNLLTAKVLAEGPINKGKGSLLISGRITHNAELLSAPLQRIYFQTEEDYFSSYFGDLNLKFNYKLSKKDRIYLSLFTGSDFFQKSPGFLPDSILFTEVYSSWHNSVMALRWNHLFNSKLFANTTITGSSYGFDYSSLEQVFTSSDTNFGEFEELNFINSISTNRDWGIRTDFDYLPNLQHSIKFGFGLSSRQFIPDLTYFDEQYVAFEELDSVSIEILQGLITSNTYSTGEGYFYAEDDWQVNSKLRFRAGLRGSAFWSNGWSHYRLEPRLRASYQSSDKLQFSASINRMVQYLHLISNSAIRVPTDLWIPSTNNIQPQESWQSEIGLRYAWNDKLRFSADIYYKDMNNLYAYPEGFNFLENLDNRSPEDYVVWGKGNAFGIELMLSYEEANRGGMISYTLGRSRRQYNEQNLGLSYPHEYDSRHQFKFFAYQKIGKNLDLSIDFLYFSPSPRLNLLFSPGGEGLRGIDLNPAGKKNFFRGESYSRLDAQASYQFHTGRFKHTFKAGLYNGLNQNNVAYYELIFSQNSIREGNPIYSLPLLPSFSYSVKF